MTKTKTPPACAGYTLNHLADLLGIPRRTLATRADRGLVKVQTLHSAGEKTLRFVPAAAAMRMLAEAGVTVPS